jgi:ubiquinone/menaquinone biosynthesis C-methylase UbiE|tara:strand:+ start:1387 stop:2337 length:951 start_codon:yes stop_codon:yes gene_type:complete
MINHLIKTFTNHSKDNIAYKYLLSIALIYGAFIFYRNREQELFVPEGFQQREPFVYKQNNKIYDTFYAEIYDELTESEKRARWELTQLVRLTDPDPNNSIFLDVGSGTGNIINELTTAGYRAHGIDKSKDMVEYCETKCPKSEFTHGDVTDNMMFDKNVFTHILCTDFTLYQMEDKTNFFTNCYHWLKPGGYLLVHLVDKKRFSITTRNDDPETQWQPMFKTDTKRKTDVKLEYEDFKYHGEYQFAENTNKVTFKETFVDKDTKHVRINEQVLFMEDIREITNLAKSIGFIFHAKVDMGNCNNDDNQYLYVLEKPQ